MSRAELVILDCDGVLVDSERIGVEVDRRVLADLGWQLSVEEIVHRWVGRSEAAYVADIEQHLGRRLLPGWDAAYRRWYADAFAAHLVEVPGVSAAVDAITVPTCVASSGNHQRIEQHLRQVGLWERFAGRVVSAQDVQQAKPAPDLFLLAADRMGVPPDRCVVVEDSAHGVQAARAAGMHVFAYAGGVTPAHLLVGSDTTVFDDMARLPELLEAWVPARHMGAGRGG